ncbi:MAG: glutaredoxin family protein [Planctomycetes bacterium]|nr:glutaredoxin family protein [Planctomycetota bacterium]
MSDNNSNEMHSLIVYSAELCGDCQRLKAFLQEHNIPHENRDIRKNPAFGEELEERTGKLGVPYLVLDGEWKIGYEPGVGFTDSWARKALEVFLED